MARLYSNENFPVQAVRWLRRLGHDVLTSFEAGKANQAIPDEQVLSFAAMMNRILITENRLHFLRLHKSGTARHAGIVVCTYHPDFERLGRQIDAQVTQEADMTGKLMRVYRPSALGRNGHRALMK